MPIMIVASKTCRHRPVIERELQAMGVPYSVQFVEDEPEMIEKYAIHSSPNLVVDDKVVFRGKPGKQLLTRAELRALVQSTF